MLCNLFDDSVIYTRLECHNDKAHSHSFINLFASNSESLNIDRDGDGDEEEGEREEKKIIIK